MATMTSTMIIRKPRLSVKTQTLAAVFAVAGAVVLPQLFHVMGAITGLGTALGEIFLPMHLPIILAGFLAGPYVGAISGFIAPLLSHFLSGMPGIAMLPFMMVELCAYGLCAGLLRNVKIPTLAKVLVTQVAGRAVRAVVILFTIYVLHRTAIRPEVIWKSIPTGLFGLALQWTFLPLAVYWVENRSARE